MPVTPVMMSEDRRSLTVRLSSLQYIIAIIFGVLGVAFWVFQVAQHEKFEQIAEENHLRRLPLPAPRGVLFDRHGKVLVENQSTFNIALVREQTKDLDQTLHALALATGADEALMRETVNRRRREPSYRPIVLIENAAREQWFAVAARNLPGIIYQPVPTRKYPASELAAHVFGYVGEVTEAQLVSDEYRGAEPGAVVGHAGVEKALNRYLMGKDGTKEVIVNSLGREINVWHEEPPTEGQRVQLTIDADVQKAIEDGFTASTFNGAAVVLDPRNGEVLGFPAVPAYDPNAFAAGIDRATWNSLNTDDLRPLQNRALQGRYSPGSTFKMAVGLAGLEEGIITPDFRAHLPRRPDVLRPLLQVLEEGRSRLGRPPPRHRAVVRRLLLHGRQHARRRSHPQVGDALRSRREVEHRPAQRGHRPGAVDRPGRRRSAKTKWYAGETISVAIGQGQVSVTPISLAVYDGDAGQRRHPRHAARAQGHRTTARSGSRCRRRRRSRRRGSHLGEAAGGSRRHVARRQRRRAARAARARLDGQGRLRQDRHGTGHLATGRGSPPHEQEPPRSRLVRVLRAARQPGNRRRGLRRARHPQRDCAPRSPAHPRHLLREEGRPAAAAACRPPSR